MPHQILAECVANVLYLCAVETGFDDPDRWDEAQSAYQDYARSVIARMPFLAHLIAISNPRDNVVCLPPPRISQTTVPPAG